MLTRRTLLQSSAGLLGLALGAPAIPALADPPRVPPPRGLSMLDLTVEGPREFGRRFTLFLPTHLAPGERAPLLVLLHGLGESGDPALGVFAWHERYGLGAAYDRLLSPPILRTSKRNDIRDEQLAALNASLVAQPFRGLCIACPFTPNLGRMPNPAATHEAYATWLCDVVIPRARKEAQVSPDPAHTYLDGCSMGGPIGLETLLRRPDQFAAWGAVQSAFSTDRAHFLADRLSSIVPKMARLPGKGPSTAIHLETSSGDPFHEANLALSKELSKKGIAHDVLDLPGPHDQPWLREAGTLAMLLWYAQRPR
ncbi:MAG: hypothetical protein U0359_20635 [Byssovorax sp.]